MTDMPTTKTLFKATRDLIKQNPDRPDKTLLEFIKEKAFLCLHHHACQDRGNIYDPLQHKVDALYAYNKDHEAVTLRINSVDDEYTIVMTDYKLMKEMTATNKNGASPEPMILSLNREDYNAAHKAFLKYNFGFNPKIIAVSEAKLFQPA